MVITEWVTPKKNYQEETIYYLWMGSYYVYWMGSTKKNFTGWVALLMLFDAHYTRNTCSKL
jgi:phage terminase large subunit-like protein